jgi:hypothetical protein
VCVVTATAICLTVVNSRGRRPLWRSEIAAALESTDPQARKEAAWRLIERPDPLMVTRLVRGLMGAEPSPDVREAYVYTLGRLGDSRNFPAIESAIDSDPSGYVRAAAWLAAARADPQHFRTLVATRAPPEHPWDRIGVAQGRLCLGDTSAVEKLLHWAVSGDDSQRNVASRALFKWLRPLLDAVGRWPVGASVGQAQTWPPALIEEVAARCATLDLQAIAEDTRPHLAQAERVRRSVKRITHAREGLVHLLFAE